MLARLVCVAFVLVAALGLDGCGDVASDYRGSEAHTDRILTSGDPHSLARGIGAAAGSARVIVKFRADREPTGDEVERAAWLSRRIGTSLGHGRALGRRTQSLRAESLSSARLLKALESLPEVEWAVEDRRQSIRSLPDDPLFPAGGAGANAVAIGQWFLRAPTDAIPAAVDAQRAWERQKGDPNVVVAVVDTGVITNHPDLNGKLRPGYDFVSDRYRAADGDRRDGNPDDPGDATVAGECEPAESAQRSSWHGTQVAGLIGAATNNGVGVASIGRNVSVLPVRVLGRCGGYDSDIIAGMLWAAGVSSNVGVGRPINVPNLHPAQVINISLGSQGNCSRAYSDALAQILENGVTVVAAAGNDTGYPVASPANCPGVIAVAGIRHSGTKVGYSNLGPQVSLAAPAGNCANLRGPCLYPLVTTTNSGLATPSLNTYSDSTNYSVGTSFAAPLVAATAALMRSANPRLTPVEIRRILQRTAQPFPVAGAQAEVQSCKAPVIGQEQLECYCTTSTCGAGMLNAYDAVSFAADLADANQPYRDSVERYNPERNQLQIAKVEVGAATYHNVVVSMGQLLSVGTQVARDYPVTRYDPASGVLAIAEVSVGRSSFLNVSITIRDVLQFGVP